MMAALVLAAAVAASPVPHVYDAEALAALDAMEKAAAATNDYTMTLVKRELRGDELGAPETIVIKWQRPQKIYLREVLGPQEGQEVIYVPGWNKNKIRVHKGSFPDVNISLDPYGNLAMGNSHHPVPEVSLIRLVDRVMTNVRLAQSKRAGQVTFQGEDTLFERPTVKIEAKMPPTGKTPTLKKGETLWDIARATGQSMYVILHANRGRGWTQPDHPKPGDAVMVPDFYAGRMVVWIDKELHLPVQIDLYDHEGSLYEHYEHRYLAVNVGLTAADFDPKNPAYHF
jgi:outer membrane lipoprotein-sorting protein/LysM repeat protein